MRFSKMNNRIKQLVFNDQYDIDSEAKLVEQMLTSKSANANGRIFSA